MLDHKKFNFANNQQFDLKGFMIKITSYWKWFVVSLIIAFICAYQVNIRKPKQYGLGTTIAIKEENNPFFTSNTSLVFNWGGTSDKVQTITTLLLSRTHNEKVVEQLQFYIDYFKQGDYYDIDSYGDVPFYIKIDNKQGQLLNQKIKIKFLNQTQYLLQVDFDSPTAELYNYSKNKTEAIKVSEGQFIQKYNVGQKVKLPFVSFVLEINDHPGNYSNEEFSIKFNDFDTTVAKYQDIKINSDEKSGSILTLSLEGTNKARMVDYLNTTVKTLIKSELDRKNLFATNTIKFIDSTLAKTEKLLKDSNEDLKTFQNSKKTIDLELDGVAYTEQLQKLDENKDFVLRKIVYCNSLKNYLLTSKDFSKLPAPSVAGIEEPNIVVNVSKLISLSISRSQMTYSVKNIKMFNDFDNEMQAIKNVLLENINSYLNALNYDVALVTKKINQSEATLKQLPVDRQELVKIQRKYNLNDNVYSTFLAKKSEAEIVKAANLSDIHFIDTAKDTGGLLIGPRTGVNYILAFLLGILIPFLILGIIFYSNNSIQNIEDVSRLTEIPIIGVIGKKYLTSNLAVFEKPRSAMSESFRAVRSSLQFQFKKLELNETKTIMVTSSISGEGKTFCSINLATVFALSEKRTVVVGLDLRKPKLFEDFQITNSKGIVNYLIGDQSLEQITQATHIPFLDIITSGPIPPNPSELIISEIMSQLMQELKTKYDYIILDTPPIGLVADALELVQYIDITLYVVRQNITKKGMINILNNKTNKDEIKNVSILLNGFESKKKFGYSNRYEYGYENYTNSYYESNHTKQKNNIFAKILKKDNN